MWKCHQFEKKRDKISDHSQNFFSRDNKNRIDQTEKAASLNEHQVKGVYVESNWLKPTVFSLSLETRDISLGLNEKRFIRGPLNFW